MSKPRGIIVFGANGSGKTTFARELARILNFRHMDIEDYCFKESEIPYAKPRAREECIILMRNDIEKYGSFVLSAVSGDFGENITSLYDLAILLEAPLEIRMKRIKQRSYEQFGERVREGGDMYEQEQKFFHFAAARSLAPVEQWAKRLACPVIRVDGAEDYRLTAVDAANFYRNRFISIGLPAFPDGAEVIKRVSVRGVCVRDGKALMIKYKWPGYGFPGGGMEAGESVEETIIRELSEEIGCKVVSVGKFLLSVTERRSSEASPGKYFEGVQLYYECQVDAESAFIPHPTQEEMEREYDGAWIDLREALHENEPEPQRERDVAVLRLLLEGAA
ncbi:MAG: NUDIX domain-containing protein [Clostridiales bacterium]|jgi:8-oxo-dGTP pyrophosphatase MutT (NUDIX family)/adenylate kinase family enzyme|nr:NUDIX domain-containing protein [Clostridiales bacterium]